MSCICLTYGRPRLLEEAIASFLKQDYSGRRELIVLNDCAAHTLDFDHPEVGIVNVRRRFRTVGAKMNAAVALAAHDLLFVWDDDDIYLPHRLSLSVARYEGDRGFFKPDRAWLWNDGVLSGPVRNVFHAGSCWSRAFFDEVGGYPAMGNGYDQAIEERFESARPGSTAPFAIPDEEVYYLYRWGTTGSYHMSGFGQEDPRAGIEQVAVTAFVEAQLRGGAMPVGHLRLQPMWRTDYVQLTQAALGAKNMSNQREM